jgi:hypothetical protein
MWFCCTFVWKLFVLTCVIRSYSYSLFRKPIYLSQILQIERSRKYLGKMLLLNTNFSFNIKINRPYWMVEPFRSVPFLLVLLRLQAYTVRSNTFGPRSTLHLTLIMSSSPTFIPLRRLLPSVRYLYLCTATDQLTIITARRDLRIR